MICTNSHLPFHKLILFSLYKYANFDMACGQLFLFISFITRLFSIVSYYIKFSSQVKQSNITFFSVHLTTETLTKTDLMKTTTILITTQQITEQNKTIGIYNLINYLYLELYAWFCSTYITDTHFLIFVWFLRRSTEGLKQ